MNKPTTLLYCLIFSSALSGQYSPNVHAKFIHAETTSSRTKPIISTYKDMNEMEIGSVSLYFGSLQMDTIPDAIFYGRSSFEHFGFCISSAGDFNNDGFDDFIVGSYEANHAYIFLGGESLDTEPGLILSSPEGSQWFGENVSFAGDVNSDGFSDVIVGDIVNGSARVFLGNRDMDKVSSINFHLTNPNSSYGNCVSSAGDFNGDGFDDIIVGDPGAGRAFVYFGGNPMNTVSDLTLRGEESGDKFGIAVSYAGDVNRDGFSDIIVGAPWFDYPNGRVYIYYGNSSPDDVPDIIINSGQSRWIGYYISGAGDLNRDGYDDIMVGVPYLGNGWELSYVNIYYGGKAMDAEEDIILSEMDYAFGTGVSGAGDLNNDGYDDILICKGEFVFPGLGGFIYIFHGGPEMDTIPDLILPAKDQLFWDDENYEFSIAGDVNKDGFTDIIIGSSVRSAEVLSNHTANTIEYTLDQNYPNPFTSSTDIHYYINKPCVVKITIFSLSGQEIETIVHGYQIPGEYEITWHPGDLPGGIYFYQLQSNYSSNTKKLILIK
jgi:hypothetical protein